MAEAVQSEPAVVQTAEQASARGAGPAQMSEEVAVAAQDEQTEIKPTSAGNTAAARKFIVPPDTAAGWPGPGQLLFAPATTCQLITCLVLWLLLLAACGVAIWLLLPKLVDHVIEPALHWIQVGAKDALCCATVSALLEYRTG